MAKVAIVVTLIFGVILPTFDNYMDMIIGFRMLLNYFGCTGVQEDEMRKIGISTMVIVSFSFLMITWQWMRFEEEKFKTLPILLLQLWPQYRSLRVI